MNNSQLANKVYEALEERCEDFVDHSSWFWDGKKPIPSWNVHSGNPVGKKNITSYMESWEKSLRTET